MASSTPVARPVSTSHVASVATLLTELFRDYLGQGQAAAPQALMRDYVAQEREALKSEESRRFWAARLEEAPLTALPAWPGFGPAPQRQAERLRFEVPAQMADGLHEMARQLGIPVKSVLLAAHLRVLALIGGQSEVTTGLVLNARPEEIDGRITVTGGTLTNPQTDGYELATPSASPTGSPTSPTPSPPWCPAGMV